VLLTAAHIIQCCSQLDTLSSVAHSCTHYPVLLTAGHIIHLLLTAARIIQCCSQLDTLSSVAHSWTHFPVLFTAGHIFQCCPQLDTSSFFYVLLTVHLSIFISVFNQLYAQSFYFTISLFHASTCFEHMCSSSSHKTHSTNPVTRT